MSFSSLHNPARDLVVRPASSAPDLVPRDKRSGSGRIFPYNTSDRQRELEIPCRSRSPLRATSTLRPDPASGVSAVRDQQRRQGVGDRAVQCIVDEILQSANVLAQDYMVADAMDVDNDDILAVESFIEVHLTQSKVLLKSSFIRNRPFSISIAALFSRGAFCESGFEFTCSSMVANAIDIDNDDILAERIEAFQAILGQHVIGNHLPQISIIDVEQIVNREASA